jgi:hypothetical protein
MRIPHPFDPFRALAWRHLRCAGLLDLGRRPSRRRDDAATWRGWRYLAAVRRAQDDRGRERARRRYPDLDAAHRLRFCDEDLLRGGLEGYLLAGVPPPEADERFDLVPGTAGAYAEQFFDVLGHLHARDWVINVVIRLHARPAAVKDAETHLRLSGFKSGRRVVDALLDYYAHPVTSPTALDGAGEEERRKLRQRLQVHLSILLTCLPEASVKPWTWEVLSGLSDRLARNQAPISSSVRLDVSSYLAGIDPAAPQGLEPEASRLVGFTAAG